jgi:hypothetical protein
LHIYIELFKNGVLFSIGFMILIMDLCNMLVEADRTPEELLSGYGSSVVQFPLEHHALPKILLRGIAQREAH